MFNVTLKHVNNTVNSDLKKSFACLPATLYNNNENCFSNKSGYQFILP